MFLTDMKFKDHEIDDEFLFIFFMLIWKKNILHKNDVVMFHAVLQHIAQQSTKYKFKIIQKMKKKKILEIFTKGISVNLFMEIGHTRNNILTQFGAMLEMNLMRKRMFQQISQFVITIRK